MFPCTNFLFLDEHIATQTHHPNTTLQVTSLNATTQLKYANTIIFNRSLNRYPYNKIVLPSGQEFWLGFVGGKQ